jgi:hypothetical protein
MSQSESSAVILGRCGACKAVMYALARSKADGEMQQAAGQAIITLSNNARSLAGWFGQNHIAPLLVRIVGTQRSRQTALLACQLMQALCRASRHCADAFREAGGAKVVVDALAVQPAREDLVVEAARAAVALATSNVENRQRLRQEGAHDLLAQVAPIFPAGGEARGEVSVAG